MRRRPAAVLSVLLAAALVAVASLASAVELGASFRVSVGVGATDPNGPSGQPLGGPSGGPLAISANGRYVAFHSSAQNLVVEDGNGEQRDVFVLDRETGTTTLVSVATDGAAGNGASSQPQISANGRFVVFESDATNLAEGDFNGVTDVFLHDRDADGDEVLDELGGIATIRVSVDTAGEETSEASIAGGVSDDGRFVSFSTAGPLTEDDLNEFSDVFVRDRDANGNNEFDEPDGVATIRVSVSGDGTEVDGASSAGGMSGDGRHVAFTSDATNLVADDANGVGDVFVHDRDPDANEVFDEPEATLTTLVSVSSAGEAALGFSHRPAISPSGRFVVFESFADNLVDGDTNGSSDVFLHDRDLDGDGMFDDPGNVETIRASVGSDGVQLLAGSVKGDVSDDGNLVVFQSAVFDDAASSHVWVHDRDQSQSILISTTVEGVPADDNSEAPAISGDGSTVAYSSLASDIGEQDVPDGNGTWDVYGQILTPTPLPTMEPTPTPVPLSATVSLDAMVDSELDEVEAGAATVPIADVPPDALLTSSSEIEWAPLRNIELAESPLRNIPLRNIPLRNISLSLGLAAEQLDSILLSSVPLLTEGGWEAVLAGTALQGVPLHTVTLHDVLSLDPLPGLLDPGSTEDPLTLAEIDLSASPLRNIGLSSILLGATPLRNIPIEGDWCTVLASFGFPCGSTTGISDGSTLLALDLAGVPLRNIPLRNIPLRNIDLVDAPLRNIPLAALSIEVSPLRNIPLRNISLCESLFDTTKVDCSDASAHTLGDAAALGAVLSSTTVGDIVDHLETLPADDPLSQLTVNDILVALLDALDFPWENLPLDELGVQDFASSGGEVTYEVHFSLSGGVTTADADVRVQLPDGFRVVAPVTENGSLTSDEVAVSNLPFDEPVVNGSQVTFSFEGLSVGVNHTLAFKVRPSLHLGSGAAIATVQAAGASEATSAPAAVTVVETFGSIDDAPAAPVLVEGVLYLSHITSPDDFDFFRIAAPSAGSRITVHLSHLAEDNDLVVYSPAGSDLRAVSPRSIGLQSTAIEDDGLDLNSTDDSLPPDTVQDVPILLDNVASVSAGRSTAEEQAEAVSDGEGDFYTIQVSGYNGATSDQPYVLRVEIDGPIVLPPCDPRTLPNAGAGSPGTYPTLPAEVETIFLINQQRFGDTHGAAGQNDVLGALSALAAREDVKGVIVPVESVGSVAAAYGAWDANPCSPAAANAVVNAIGGVIDNIRTSHPELSNVVIVGGDDIVPMARVPDLTTLANERDYASTFAGQDVNNQYLGALATEHILSDDPYVDFDPIPFLDRHLFLPDIALGRLVEGPIEIVAQVNNYIASDGLLDPQTALTTGYDFLTDGANQVAGALDGATAGGGQALINETWDTAALVQAFLEGEPPQIASVNAHYDHNRALPALGNSTHDESDLFETGHLVGTDLTGRVLFTMGCHAGLSVADVVVGTTDERAPDWAQGYHQHGAAAYAANTGYGYGDTAAVAYSERLMAIFAEKVGGPLSVGDAWVFSKQEHFAQLNVVSVYDEKSLTEATLYGLPMYRMASPLPAPEAPAPPVTSTDPVTGLEVAEIVLEPEFTQQSTPIGEYYAAALAGETTGGTQVTHYRPVQPLVDVDVTQPDAVAHDALITGLEQLPDEVLDGAFSRPIIDLSANEPETAFADAIFPSRFQAVTTYNAPDGQRQRLVVIPGQFFTDEVPDPEGIGTQRLFSRVDALVMYGDPDEADFVRPTIREVEAVTIGSAVSFTVVAEDLAPTVATASTGGVGRVLILFHHEANPLAWVPVDLIQIPGTTTWTGGAPLLDVDGNPAPGSAVEYFVQAVDAVGNVGISIDKGRYFAAPIVSLDSPAGTTVSGPTVNDSGWFTGTVTVTVTGSDLSYSINGADPAPITGDSFSVTDDGIHRVEILNGEEVVGTLVIPIDTEGPAIAIDTPPNDAIYGLGEVVNASYRCTDALSGVAECAGPVGDGAAIDTASIGPKTFAVSAADIAGNAAPPVATTYDVHYNFDGFFDPVDNPPTLNEVRAGSGVPIKFSLGGDQGLGILDSTRSYRVECGTTALLNAVEETTTAGSSGLIYDATEDQYLYAWRTSKSWRGTCRQFVIVLNDGTEHTALFRFR